MTDEEKRRRDNAFFDCKGRAIDYGRQIPPPLNPSVVAMVNLLLNGYDDLTAKIAEFRTKITELVEAGKLDAAEQTDLLTRYSALQDAIDTAADNTERWESAGPDANTITPEINRIADLAKYVYAV